MRSGRFLVALLCFVGSSTALVRRHEANHELFFHIQREDVEVPNELAEPKGSVEEGPNLWAVLVAGSNGYYNYRHQADVCHAYHVLRQNGIPAENIITMIYDDIADNEENPTKGIIINHPNGTDVYQGVVKDYIGKDVTPENFLKILAGKADDMNDVGSGKVLKSGANDHVFINFVDHGAPGLLAFPSAELHARELQDTLLDMYHKKRFKKLVMYIEACESGSMFENLLPDNLNIFVTTAANAHEHSYACYYDEERGTYLGDLYSVMWMEDSEMKDLAKETLFQQFSIVRKETNLSHVQEYGDLTIGKMKVADFQGFAKRNTTATGSNETQRPRVSPVTDAVPSGDVPMEILWRRLKSAGSHQTATDIRRKIRHAEKKRKFLIDTIHAIVLKSTDGSETKSDSIMNAKLKLTDFTCYEEVVRAFSHRCFHLPSNEFAYRKLFVFVNLCQSRIPKEKILAAMDQTCHPHKKFTGII